MGAIKWNRRGLVLALVAVGALGAQTAMAAAKKVPLPKPRPVIHAAKEAVPPVAHNLPLPQKRPQGATGLSAFAQANVGLRGGLFESRALFKPLARPVSGPFAVAPTTTTSQDDIDAVKRAIEAARKGKLADADAAENAIKESPASLPNG